MAKAAAFRCGSCGVGAPKWLGRCPECGEWDGLEAVGAGPRSRSHTAATRRVPLAVVAPETGAGAGPGMAPPMASGVHEFDRVLSGGLTAGSVTLLGGEPGIGKSTLVLQVLAGIASDQRRCLLVTAEESEAQVSARAQRVGAAVPGLEVLAATSLLDVLDALDATEPTVVVLDSVHTVSSPDAAGAPGSVSQVQSCALEMTAVAKQRDTVVVLVGHVTKDGSLAGPRALEHVVDTVLSFEGDRHQPLRTLRVLKHRFGRTGEVGLLEMGSDGLIDVEDPAGVFLTDRRPGTPGSVVVPVLEGMRPLLVEVQALVSATRSGVPRRSVQGLDPGRLALLIAVLDRATDRCVGGVDVYANVAGGLRVREPGADLGVTLALLGADVGVAVGASEVVIGEVGLSGEVRQVAQADRRLAEAARLGFTRAIAPLGTPEVAGITIDRVGGVVEAATAAGLI